MTVAVRLKRGPLHPDIKRKVVMKGGPGSGHHGHSGRPGMVGGSVAGISASFDMSTWLAGQRKRMPTPVRDAISGAIEAKMAEKEVKVTREQAEAEVEMYLDVMVMDEERFQYYAGKLGIDPALAGDFFKEQKTTDQELLRKRYDMQKRMTYERAGADFLAMDKLYGDVKDKGLVGANSAEARRVLSEEYGVQVSSKISLSEEAVHENLSYVINAARTNPLISRVVRNELDYIRFENHPTRDSAVASAGYRHINIHPTAEEWRSPLTMVHELGHVHSYHDKNWIEAGGFGSGRHTSSYGWLNPDEDYAETFVAAMAGSQSHRDWVPNKYDHILESFE